MTSKNCKYFIHNLTDAYVRSLKAKHDMQITDKEIRGLHLRYSGTSGCKVFYLSYQIKHSTKQRNLKVGRFEEFSIKDIRYRALTYRQMVSDGRDPMQEQIDEAKKRAEELAKRRKIKELLQEYMEKYSKLHKKPSTSKSDQGMIDRHINPVLGEIFISDLDIPKLTDFYNNVAKKTSYSTANHNMALISNFWNWCERYKYLPLNSNPCRLVDKGKNKKIEYKLLDLAGYQRLFAAIEDGISGKSSYNIRAFRAIKILALTGCRHSEITELKKSELKLDSNLLALEDSKTGAKKVPLGAPAVAELRIALAESPSDSPFLFPATRLAKTGTGAIIDIRKAFHWALKRAGLPIMRVHDLRHSFATMATAMGENIHSIKEVLGHKYTTTTEIYAHVGNEQKINTANNVASKISAMA